MSKQNGSKRDKMGDSEALSPQQEQAITALLTAPTQEQAAAAVGIGSTTLYRWLRDETFMSRYREAQTDLYLHAMSRIQQTTSEAIETLREIMADDTAPHAARVTSAKAILDQATNAHAAAIDAQEITEIKERLEKYIALTEEQNQHRDTRGRGWV